LQRSRIHCRTCGGYKIKLNWKPNKFAKFYKIYKTSLPKQILDKKFSISQKALEKFTQAQFQQKSTSNILYNKNFFAVNSNIDLQNTNNNRFLDNKKSMQFQFLAQIMPNKNDQIHTFFDKNVKFGKSYAYFITMVDENLHETQSTAILNIAVQDLQFPNKPDFLNLYDTKNGIVISSSNKKDKDLKSFLIFRRNEEINSNFEKIAEIDAKKDSLFYVDKDVIPGNQYEYKVFCVDAFDNISLECQIKKKGFNGNLFVNDATIPFPEVKIEKTTKSLKFFVKKNDDSLIGFTIQRKDFFKNDFDFEFKSTSKTLWPNLILFDDKNFGFFEDSSINLNEIYQYRIYTVQKNQRPGAYYFSPIIKLQEFDVVDFKNKQDLNFIPFKLNSYSFEVVNSKQVPVFIKATINAIGWSYVLLKSKDGSFFQKIESIHKQFFFQVEKNKKYDLEIIFFNEAGLLKNIKGIIVQT
jgi:hypothetical protein